MVLLESWYEIPMGNTIALVMSELAVSAIACAFYSYPALYTAYHE